MKRFVGFFLVFAAVAALGPSWLWARGRQDAGSGKMPELVWAFMTWGAAPRDIDKVQTAMSEYLAQKIGATVKLLPISSGEWSQKTNLMLASPSEDLDLFPVLSFNTPLSMYVSKGQLLPIDDLLTKNGQGTIQAVGRTYLEAGKAGGVQYAVPSLHDLASGTGILITKEYVDKYKLNVNSVKKLEDLTGILAEIKRNEPNYAPLVFDSGSSIGRLMQFDGLGDNLGVLLFRKDANTVVNLFESDEYRQTIELLRSWYQAGYISRDVAARTEGASAQLRAGTGCVQFTAVKPDIEIENEQLVGKDLVFIDVSGNHFTTTQNVQIVMWGIANNSKNPEKAMELLNLLYTDPVLINMINFGIEGEHYVKKSDGTIGYPPGVTGENSRYTLSMEWALGNQFLGYVWEGKPANLYELTKKQNDAATPSPALGFNFDSSKVITQVSALTAVLNQYQRALETGSADLGVLDEFNQKLKAAGIADVIAEKQKQYDAWKAGK
jgi:putative aldouronate transport system substrate-binding protein